MLQAGLSLLILIVGILSGLPVAFGFTAAVLFMVLTLGYDPMFLVPYSFNRMRSLVLLAIPFFILAGNIMEKGDITKYLIAFIDSLVSRIRGGMAAVGVVANGIFGAISGSAAAAICCIGPIMIPRLESEGYPRGYATSIMTSAAGLALLIPPSLSMIFYGWLTYTSVTACFLAGFFPGVLLMFFLIAFNWIAAGRMPAIRKPRPWGDLKQASKEMFSTGFRALPALSIPVLILGSIYAGIATPTEAAAVAMVYAIPLGFFIYRGMTLKGFANALTDSSATIGAVMVLLFLAMMLGRMFVMENVPETITVLMLSVSENKYVILLMVNAILILMGMFMDDVTGLVIGAPLLLPVVEAIGISPVHFSAIITTNLIMGLFTPPMAPLIYIGQRIGNTTFPEMIRTSMLLVVFAYLPVLLISTYWPPISEWLPTVVLGSRVLN